MYIFIFFFIFFGRHTRLGFEHYREIACAGKSGKQGGIRHTPASEQLFCFFDAVNIYIVAEPHGKVLFEQSAKIALVIAEIACSGF